MRGFTHALHYEFRMLQYFLAVILSNVCALQRWKSGEAWTKKGLADFLSYGLLLGLPWEGGRRRRRRRGSPGVCPPVVALDRGHQEA